MFSMKLKDRESWLDPESAGILGWKLGKRLWARCKGHEGRFITLTYDRKNYLDAQDCFDKSRAQKHVSRFMRKLGAAINCDLRGKWICKLEFQEGGWVHWHILLLDVGYIPQKIVLDIWGKGFIHLKQLNEANAMYLTKYVAKDGSIPGFVYDYPSRSIKVVRASLGFWNDEQAKRAREKAAKSRRSTRAQLMKGAKREEQFYVPVGEKLRQEAVLFRTGRRTFSLKCSRLKVLQALRKYCGQPKVEGTWRHYADGDQVLDRVVVECDPARTSSVRKQSPAAGATAPHDTRPLFLKGTGNRVGWWLVLVKGKYRTVSPADIAGRLSKWWAKNAPWWTLQWIEQEARYQLGMTMHGHWGEPSDARPNLEKASCNY